MCHLSLLVSARVLDDFRGISCFVIFKRDTCCFGDSAQPCTFGCFVVTVCRCGVSTHAATFCSLVEKTPAEAVVSRLCERRCLVQIPREALLHKWRNVIKLCDMFSIHCFQLARLVLVCFFLCPVVEVFVNTSHMMSHRTWFRALDFSLLQRVSLVLRIKNMSHRV